MLVLPAPQLKHAADDVDPVLGLYLPAAQLVQLAAPPVGLYVLMGHAWHGCPEMLVLPAPQLKHWATEVEPGKTVYLPAAQKLQKVWPVNPWYWLMGQGEHDWPAVGLYWPAGQFRHTLEVEPVNGLYLPATQLVHAACPVDGLYVLIGHNWQSKENDEPMLGLYVPVPQSVHDAWPVIALYLPV